MAGFSVLDAETVPLPDLLGRVLAETVVAQNDMPPFANSAMDGYALRAQDSQSASKDTPKTLEVIGDVAAGAVLDVDAAEGTAVRIMTGAAPLPDGFDSVIPVEDTNEQWRGQGTAVARPN